MTFHLLTLILILILNCYLSHFLIPVLFLHLHLLLKGPVLYLTFILLYLLPSSPTSFHSPSSSSPTAFLTSHARISSPLLPYLLPLPHHIPFPPSSHSFYARTSSLLLPPSSSSPNLFLARPSPLLPLHAFPSHLPNNSSPFSSSSPTFSLTPSPLIPRHAFPS